MGIWLYEVKNISTKALRLRKGSSNWQLNEPTNMVNVVTGYWDDDWNFSYGDINVRVFDDGDWGLQIEVKKSGRNTLSNKWEIEKNYTQVNFVFEEDTVWVYPTTHPLKKDGHEHLAWSVNLHKEWKWEPYDIDA
ncbi:uncharacterized protein LOC131152747 [Malania oleifera]|uniref:uncharacterized protein LOC131152747 n=1 Tax=Malania oleifera TaxID=397392 RepID=UPI0025AE4FD7|nr:uncharacterized protein LOC131152747 [Malania oleifera]